MLIIFDVDGTLLSGELTDWRCFDDAIHQVTGVAVTAALWKNVQEVTARAIVHQMLPAHLAPQRESVEKEIRVAYLHRLRAAHARDPAAFPATNGAAGLLKTLRARPNTQIAIATGDWLETTSFKLAAAGLNIAGIPMATSSDCHRRVEIIRLAAQRAGGAIEQTVYVGDGLWDWRATQELGIPFIGVGHRKDRLRTAGASHVLPNLEPEVFIQSLSSLQAA